MPGVHNCLLRFSAAVAMLVSAGFCPGQDRPAGTGASAPNANSPTGAMTLDQVIKSLDKDGDGQVSKAEATGNFAQRFASWDSNSDGFATRDEIQAFRRQRGIDDDGGRLAPARGNAPGNTVRRPAASANKILKEPANWREEQLPIPPGFAPDITWKGSEECRFSPGMYDTSSPEYFSYAVALILDGQPDMSPAEFKKFLESYFRGLSSAVARRGGSRPDASRMVATVSRASDSTSRLLAEMTFFDSFTDGREIRLVIEADIQPRPTEKKTYVILLISPSGRESETWKRLREVGAGALKNVP